MMVRSLALFAHLVGVLLLFAALAVERRCLKWMRAPGPALPRVPMTDMLAAAQHQMRIALGLILASGAYMAAQFGVFEFAWVRVSFGAMVLIGIAGGPLVQSPIRALRQGQDAPHPLLYTSVRVRMALALAIVYIMIAKPALGLSLLLIAAAVVAGAAGGAFGRRALSATVVGGASSQ